MSTLFDRIHWFATPGRTAFALLLFAAILVAMEIVDAPLAAVAPEHPKPDLVFGYDAAFIQETFDAWGPEGRARYAWSTLLDSVMPVLAAAATILVAARASRRWLPMLAIAPTVFMVTDLVENALFMILLAGHPDISESLVAVVRPITQVKLAAFWGLTVPTLAIGILVLAWRAVSSRTRRSTRSATTG
jgi:hypothetical protein